ENDESRTTKVRTVRLLKLMLRLAPQVFKVGIIIRLPLTCGTAALDNGVWISISMWHRRPRRWALDSDASDVSITRCPDFPMSRCPDFPIPLPYPLCSSHLIPINPIRSRAGIPWDHRQRVATRRRSHL